METKSIVSATKALIDVSQRLDSLGFYRQADTILDCIRTAQNATQSMLGDVPGGFYLQNLNSTAYGLKNGMGGYPGSGHSYWDANGGETARHVDLRNNMMGQEGMSAQDRVNFELEQWKKNQQDPQYQAWAAGQKAQIQRDMQMMQSRLQDPSLTREDRAAIEESIKGYQSAIESLQKWGQASGTINPQYF